MTLTGSLPNDLRAPHQQLRELNDFSDHFSRHHKESNDNENRNTTTS